MQSTLMSHEMDNTEYGEYSKHRTVLTMIGTMRLKAAMFAFSVLAPVFFVFMVRRGGLRDDSLSPLDSVFVKSKAPSVKSQEAAPNLVIILTDDHGYHDVGFNGCEDIPTPNIDSIAANGVRFTNGYVSCPVCGPSRAGLLTGRYQDRFGFTRNPKLRPDNPISGIPHSEENIAEVLKKAGYKSAIIGKWHLGSHPVNHPLKRGFDHFFGFLSGGHSYFPDLFQLNDLTEAFSTEGAGWFYTRIMRDFEPIDIQNYLTDELTDAGTAFIEKQAASGEKFLLYQAYNAPHSPFEATDEYLSRFPDIKNERRRTYAAMISAVDDGVGKILATLRKHELEEKTLVVFLSDNGGPKWAASDSWPFKGFKCDLFEGGIHVPFAMQWKNVIPAGMTYTNPVISLDIMGTITALAGVEIAKERPLDGVNLIPYLTGDINGKPHNQLFWRQFHANNMAILSGPTKLVSNTNMESYGFFNLSDDIGESRNRLRFFQKEAIQLLNDWKAWNSQLKNCTFGAQCETIEYCVSLS